MNKFFLIATLAAIVTSCSGTASDTYQISGKLNGEIPDGTAVILRKSDETFQTIDVDSTQLTGGAFTFNGKSTTPELHFIYIEGLRGGIPMILENGNISITAHRDSLQNAEISGTPQNDAYAAYLNKARSLSALRMSMNEDLRDAMMQQDSALIQSLRDEFFELQDKMVEFEKEFAITYPDALITALILDRMLESGSASPDEVENLFNKMSDSLKNSKIGMGIREKLDAMKKTSIGSKAPDFSGPTPDGTQLALKDAMGKVTLIDFWAGWCKPCRAENPNVVAVYEQYKDKGLRVLGVSLDKNAEEWKQAIANDGLNWNHISNIAYFDDEIAQLYSVRAIPASFILDENGVILAKDLRGEDLGKKMAELLGD
ncbi:MAG: hypothetical protein RLZZ241_682 [Bacteroidota bacterium]|jgi:peroxiredoxin